VSNSERFYSTIAGYYSYSTGPKYVSPIVANPRIPELIELHEFQHSYLSTNNTADAFVRAFWMAIELGKDQLQAEHAEGIRQLQHTLYEQSTITQETVATYLSFFPFGLEYPEDVVKEAREQLPRAYADVLLSGEVAFG
jgi:hypothetical protein